MASIRVTDTNYMCISFSVGAYSNRHTGTELPLHLSSLAFSQFSGIFDGDYYLRFLTIFIKFIREIAVAQTESGCLNKSNALPQIEFENKNSTDVILQA